MSTSAPPDPLLPSGSFIPMSNVADQMNPSAEQQSGSKSRKRAAPGDNWLPTGWTVEDKVRTSGATAGTVDKYYYEPGTGRKFRSRTEVLYYLEHGTLKKSGKKPDNSDMNPDHSEGQASNKPGRKAKEVPPLPPPPINFDYFDAPEEVCWSMTFGEGETWTPFIGGEKVEDAVREDWDTAFTYFTALNPSKFSPK